MMATPAVTQPDPCRDGIADLVFEIGGGLPRSRSFPELGHLDPEQSQRRGAIQSAGDGVGDGKGKLQPDHRGEQDDCGRHEDHGPGGPDSSRPAMTERLI